MTSVPHQLPLFPLDAPAPGKRPNPTYDSEHQAARMRGRHHSAETRAKISARTTGRTQTVESIAKVLATKRARGTLRSGDQAWNWKGGRPWQRFKEPRYRAWRAAVLERDGYVCQECGRQCRKDEKGLAAHHIKSYAGHPDLRYDLSNGICLCRRCHMSLHGKDMAREMVACACGCGTMISPTDAYGRPRRYVNHHAPPVWIGPRR